MSDYKSDYKAITTDYTVYLRLFKNSSQKRLQKRLQFKHNRLHVLGHKNMATKHINIRVDEALAESVEALAADKESRSAIYVRVLKSGLESITAQPEKVKSGCDGNENSLAATLKDEIEYLRKQIENKDEQIFSLTTALLNAQKEVSNAQQLHGAEKAEKLLESTEQKTERAKHPWWKFWI